MKKTHLLAAALLCLCAAFPVWSQNTWYSTYGAVTGYDPARYMTGFGISSETGNSPQALENAKKAALSDLAGKIKVQVNSTARMTTSEFGAKSFSDYQSDMKATVDLDLLGVEGYETYFDKKANRFMALSLLDTAKMRQALAVQRVEIVARLESLLSEARDWTERGRLDLLEPIFNDMGVALTELSLSLSVDSVLGGRDDVDMVLGNYHRRQDDLKAQVRRKEILTSEDLVADIVGAFDWSKWKGAKVAVLSAQYKTTEITGPFFYALRGSIEDRLAMMPEALEPAGQDDPEAALVLKGSFSETSDGWRLVYKLNDIAGKRLAGSREVTLGPRFVQAQKLAFLPANFDIAAADYDRFVSAQRAAGYFKAWTDKGTESVVYTKGETAHLFVQSDRPGYVSILYHLAGGQRVRVPLAQNWRIDASQILQPIEVEEGFEVVPPFGSETAQFFFSPEMMPVYNVKLHTVDGVAYEVLAEDFDQFLVRTRGMKPKPGPAGPVTIVEVSLSITTMDTTDSGIGGKP
jgi:hypothetical protein